MPVDDADCLVIIGSRGNPDRFYVSFFNSASGHLSEPCAGPLANDPIALTASKDGRYLYASNLGNTERVDGVSAFALDGYSGHLASLNTIESVGESPCHLSVDADGRRLVVASYDSGSLSIVAIERDGSLGRRTAHLVLSGGINSLYRGGKSHAHCTLADPSGRYLLATDLGSDKVWIIPYDAKVGDFGYGGPKFASLQAGDGPRHLALHPNRRWLYVNGEVGNSISQLEWDGNAGTLAFRKRMSALPRSYAGKNSSAELRLRPDGRFLYVSNRGHDSIAIFAIDESSGEPTLVEHVPSHGRTPRSFDIDRTGRWMLVSNSDGNNLSCFCIDPRSGNLSLVGRPIHVPKPVSCVVVTRPRTKDSRA